MKRYESRLVRLEKSRGDERLVHMHAPRDWSDQNCLDWAAERVASKWPDGGFKLGIDRPRNIHDPRLVIVATGRELDATIKEIQNSG